MTSDHACAVCPSCHSEFVQAVLLSVEEGLDEALKNFVQTNQDQVGTVAFESFLAGAKAAHLSVRKARNLHGAFTRWEAEFGDQS